MQSCFVPTENLPAWPKELPRVFKPMGRLKYGLGAYSRSDLAAIEQAGRKLLREERLRNSATTGTWTECLFRNHADYTAFASSSAEGSLLAGTNQQPVLPALFFDQVAFRTVTFLARGVFSNTGTPTLIFQCRLGTTAGSTFLSGTSAGVSAAITTGSGVTNKWWELRLDLTCNTSGIGSGNTTLSGAGYVTSPGGFASPFIYALEPTTPDTGTWTLTIDDSVTQYFNLSATWSASSASNTITCKQLIASGLN